MRRRHRKQGGVIAGLIGAAGAGAVVAMAAGALRGALEVQRLAYVENGTPWLAWAVLSQRAFREGIAGATLALGLALVLCVLPPARRALAALPVLRLPVVALGLLALLGAVTALEGSLDRRRAAGHPSVVLVSIDTLRGDRLKEMPQLQAMAAEGAVFTEAMATAPWTLPSHVSLFSSLLPFDHDVRTMRSKIPPERSMLAERFRDAGYRTGAFTGGVYVSSAFGYAQGFEVFQDHDEEKEGGSHHLFDGALAWTRARRGEPFFLFVHTYQPHLPYRRPDATFTVADAEEVYAGRRVLTPEEVGQVIALYDADVRSTDAAVGGFLATLRGEGLLDDAILVVFSDHGEDLWDRSASRSPGHGHALYQELLHVPLVVRAPGRVPPGTRVTTPVSLIDVAPTLLELCGLGADPAHRGRSFAQALRTGSEPAAHLLVAENVEYGPERFTVREQDLKVIVADPTAIHKGVRLAALPLEIYDLGRDPRESDPTSGRRAPGLRRALDVLKERQSKVVGRSAASGDADRLPEDVREQLRSLGYVQ